MANPHDTFDEDIAFETSSGNVFADLGLENADELLIKAKLTNAINKQIRERRLTQAQAAEIAVLTQPEISRITQLKVEGFSQERLQKALRNLGVDVEIRLHKRNDGAVGTFVLREIA